MDADQLLESYLGGKVPTPKGTDTPMTGDDYLKSYLSDAPTAAIPADLKRVNIDTTPKPPISGATAEQSAEINAQPSVQGGENPRDSILQVPLKAGKVVYGAAKSGILTAGEGLGEILTNKPASGFGKIGTGALNVAFSPVAGVEQFAGDITGSKDIADRAGFIAGALPVSKLGKYVPLRVPTPSNLNPLTYPSVVKKEALSEFVDAIGGKDKIPQFLKEYTSNPRLAAMDVSQPLLQTTQELAVTSGKHQNLLSDVVAKRTGSAKDAVGNIIDTTMGGPIDLKATVDRLKEKARETGKTLINPVVAKTPIVDVTDLVNGIDKEIGKPLLNAIKKGTVMPTVSPLQTELLKVRKEIRGEWADRDQMAHYTDDLHDVQSRLRVRAERLIKNGGSDANLGHDLMEVRNKIVDTIDKGTDNQYKSALKQYRDDTHVEDAFEKGQEILKNRPTIKEDDPSYWKHWVEKEATPDELAAVKEGARVAVDKQIRGMRNAVGQKGTEIPQVEFNKDKLGYVFGKDEVEAMSKNLNDERRIADSNKKLYEGSQTAQRSVATGRVSKRTDKGLEGTSILPFLAEGAGAYATGLPGIGAAGYKVADWAKRYAVNPVINKMGDAKNLELARLASATGPEKDQIVSYLSKLIAPTPKLSVFNRAKFITGP